jgi:hypothetical protein
MPRALKKNTYTIDGKKHKDWPTATAFAVQLSLQQENDVTIVERNPNTGATYYISITAHSEDASEA